MTCDRCGKLVDHALVRIDGYEVRITCDPECDSDFFLISPRSKNKKRGAGKRVSLLKRSKR